MDFSLNLNRPEHCRERHPIAGSRNGERMSDVAQRIGVTPTYKVYRLDGRKAMLWSKVYAPHEGFSTHQNLYYTSANCARKALLASWRQWYLYDYGREMLSSGTDEQIELMNDAYRVRSVPPRLVYWQRGVIVRTDLVTAYYLDGPFYLVQKVT